AGVLLQLDEASPATVVEPDGQEHPLPLPDGQRALQVRQSFTISAGAELALTLHVDLRRSIARQGEGSERRYEFGPVAHLVRQGDEGQIVGKTAVAQAAQVCAYLKRRADFNDGAFDRLPRDDHRGPGGPGEHAPQGDAAAPSGAGAAGN